MVKPEGRCPLCGKHQKLTDEHVVPQWLLGDLNQLDPDRAMPTKDGPVVLVCGPCNGWMNEKFEQRTMRIIRALMLGEERTLEASQQKRLASWSTKTLMMSTILGNPGLQYQSTSEFSYFLATHGKPLPNSRLYLGQVGPAVVRPYHDDTLIPPDGEHFNALGTTVVNIACFMYITDDGRWPAFLGHDWFRTFLRPIHPSSGPFEWPLPYIMDRALLADMSSLHLGPD